MGAGGASHRRDFGIPSFVRSDLDALFARYTHDLVQLLLTVAPGGGLCGIAGVIKVVTPEPVVTDIDTDGDVELQDMAAIQNVFIGQNRQSAAGVHSLREDRGARTVRHTKC